MRLRKEWDDVLKTCAAGSCSVAFAFVGGCAMDGGASDGLTQEEVARETEQEAYLHPGGIWPMTQVKGCFIRDPVTTVTPAEFAAKEQEFIGYFAEWEAASGFEVTWLSSCPAPIQGDYRGSNQDVVFRIFIDSDAKTDGDIPGQNCTVTESATNFGAFPSSETSGSIYRYCQYNSQIRYGSDRNKTLHEFGHKLGFLHEHSRPDGVPLGCAGGDGSSYYLTDYDPASVMGYENPACGNSEGDDGLSAGDRLGVDLLYPKSVALPLACDYCFYGTGEVITRSDATIMDKWTQLGARPWWTSTPVWKKGGSTILTAETLPVSAIGAGGPISFAATSLWNSKAISTSGLATVDDAMWTAIALSAI